MWAAALVILLLGWLHAAVLPPRWADPSRNPCATLPGGWQLLHWPGDGQCYRIFTVGTPCPDTMELAPGVDGNAECRCPPAKAQARGAAEDAPCHALFARGPCNAGFYFAPIPDRPEARDDRRLGTCQELELCAEPSHLFWPQTGRCYMRHTRGPCPKGELLAPSPRGADEPASCQCETSGPLAPYYWAAGGSCHEHYTRGPCMERGNLFLPGGQCGCHRDLPNYHADTGQCYQLGGPGPCPTGHQFILPQDREENQAICKCKEEHILWPRDGACYRIFTRGPCAPGHMLLNSTTCIPLPCRYGHLYFPSSNACHKVGMRGPCLPGQIVLFESSVRPSIDGISYRGMCGCSNRAGGADCQNMSADDSSTQCDLTVGMVKRNGVCYSLYTRGPCLEYQWLIPEREGRLLYDDFGWRKKQTKVRCECRPGYRPLNNNGGTNSETMQCQPPTFALVKFLNMYYTTPTDAA